MRNRSVKNYSVPVCLLVTSLSAAPVLADWYTNQTGQEGYYKPKEYHNDKFGNFPPADIDEKLFGHLNTTNKTAVETPVENKAQTVDTVVTTSSALPVAVNNLQAQNTAQQYSQQPAYNRNNQGSYNRNRNYSQQRNQRNNRSTSFNGPWNNNNSGLSMPWNNGGGNRGMNFGGPWDNNGSSFSGPWNGGGNNRGSNFSGPWNNNNNGSSFSMPWGNNKGNNGSGFNPMGSGGGWGW